MSLRLAREGLGHGLVRLKETVLNSEVVTLRAVPQAGLTQHQGFAFRLNILTTEIL